MSRDMRDLIEESSLGTPAARALRQSVPAEVGAELVRRAHQKNLQRKPREKWFDLIERTTHPEARMNSLPNGCTCCSRPIPEPDPPSLVDLALDYINPFKRGEQ